MAHRPVRTRRPPTKKPSEKETAPPGSDEGALPRPSPDKRGLTVGPALAIKPAHVAGKVPRKAICGGGGIGRRTILRGWRLRVWEFESPPPHCSSRTS